MLCQIDASGRARVLVGTERDCDAAIRGFYNALEIAKAKAEGALGINVTADELTHAAHGMMPNEKKQRVKRTLDVIMKFVPGN